MPIVANLSVSARVLPAREVGGDYYDLLPLPDERLVAVIGDVSGKGLPAGMIMLIVRTTLHLLVDADPDANPAKLVQILEERLVPQLDAFTFMTFLALRWSGRDRVLTWSGAGHEHILWRSTQDGVIHRIRTGGLALGLQRENFTLREERKLPLAPGDLVLLYSDGITEAMDRTEAQFSEERLIAALREPAGAANDAAALCARIVDAVNAFAAGAPQHDDMTLVAIRRTN